jgi:hypothetical protein
MNVYYSLAFITYGAIGYKIFLGLRGFCFRDKMFLNPIDFHILANFNYVLLTKYEFDQTLVDIFFNVHYIKSVHDQ